MVRLVQIAAEGQGKEKQGSIGVRAPLALGLLISPFVNVYCRSVVKYLSITVFGLLVSCFGLTVKTRAADLVVSNNAIITILGDSMLVDSIAPSVGYRFPDFLESYFQMNYPTSHIHVYNLGRSGGTMDDRLTNILQKSALALWGYQNNNNQHIGISISTDNGALSSNQMYTAQSNEFAAPGLMSDGDSNLVAHAGWAATHTVQWIGLGYIAEASVDGGPGERDRNNAGTNAGWQLGIRGVDWWYSLVKGFTNDYVKTGGLSVGWQKGGHPGAGGQLAMTFAFLKQITTDTNISTAVVDWNSAAPVSTNHCVISSVTRNGNTLTFNRQDDRLPFAWDINPLMGITNDCMQAFVLDPSYADLFKFSIGVANLPAGLYSVIIDGQLAGVVPDTVLSSANGWNMFTNITGPYWAQRTEVLGRIRDKEHVDRYTRVPGSAGDAMGMVSYGSYASTYWVTNGNRGDTLINLLSNRVANLYALDALTAQAAQPTNHTFTIMPFAPTAVAKASAPVAALNVPVILDGTSSIKATNYYWEQVSGLPQLDMIGQGTAKPMLISVTNAGAYTFRLTVSDGQTSSSSDVNVTFVQPAGRSIYVDNLLTANCLNNNYSIANRNGGGSDGLAYTNIQSAVAVTQPGDVVYIRGGLYTNAPTVPNQNMVNVTKSGTVIAPIRYENYNNERVILSGWGFSDIDTNADGLADGPNYPLLRQKLFYIPDTTDYIQVKGLELTNSEGNGIDVRGHFCYVQEIVSHDNWSAGACIIRSRLATNAAYGTVFRWVETHHNRHFTGLFMGLEDQSTFAYMTDCAFVECISDWNGYQPDGREVMPVGGDPEGGGNSGGFWTTKYFADNAYYAPQYGVHNWGQNLYFVRCVSFNNCDDGFAFDQASSVIEDNRSLFNGPTGAMGYKMLRASQSMIFRGNIAYGNMARGFEMRVDTNAWLLAFNNGAFKNAEHGFWISGLDLTSQAFCTNNVGAFNTGPDYSLVGQTYNWANDKNNVLSSFGGDPKLVNTNVTLSTAYPVGYTVRQKRDFLDNQIKKALSPALGSPLISSGAYVLSYHCPRPDNDPNSPMPLSAPGRHWKLPAPTMGPLDFQVTTGGSKPAPPTNLRVE